MMTSSNGSIFHGTGPMCWEFTGDRWIPLTKDIDADLWCFRSAPEQTVEWAIGTPVIWDAISPIMTSLPYPHFTGHVITYPLGDLSLSMLVKRGYLYAMTWHIHRLSDTYQILKSYLSNTLFCYQICVFFILLQAKCQISKKLSTKHRAVANIHKQIYEYISIRIHVYVWTVSRAYY